MKIISAVTLLLAAAAPLTAQAPPPAGPPGPPQEPNLVFEREVFDYPAANRSDPFRPLTTDDAGPQFTSLTLTGIIYMTDPSESRVTLRDSNKRQYRLRRGESVGNATVVDIGRTRVVFSIQEFGMTRTEMLDLKLTREGA